MPNDKIMRFGVGWSKVDNTSSKLNSRCHKSNIKHLQEPNLTRTENFDPGLEHDLRTQLWRSEKADQGRQEPEKLCEQEGRLSVHSSTDGTQDV